MQMFSTQIENVEALLCKPATYNIEQVRDANCPYNTPLPGHQ